MIPLCFHCPQEKPKMAVGACQFCGKDVCRNHRKIINGKTACTPCISTRVESGKLKFRIKEKTA